MTNVVAYAAAVFFAGIGAFAMFRPADVLAIFGTHVTSRDGRNEVRAVYGGFGLALAGLLAISPWLRDDVRVGVFLAVGLALAGMAGGRVVSVVIERPTTFYPVWFYLLLEAGGATALFVTAA